MQDSLQQLDLFGFPIETGTQPKKREKAVRPVASTSYAVVPQVQLVDEPILEVEINQKQAHQAITVQTNPNIKKEASKKISKRGRMSFKEMDNEIDLIEVPEDEVLQKKLYYSISEVAGWFKVNTSLLRYWENEFDILQPRKTRKGDRLFRVEDIKNLQLIYFLLRQRKFSIDGAKNYLKNNKKEADTQARLLESLSKLKLFLLEMKTNLVS